VHDSGVTSSADGGGQVITASEENVYYGGRLVAKRAGLQTAFSNGQVSDFTMDRLHSKGDGSKFYPYGESRTSAAGDDREQFATYTRDQGTGLDYADQRWYASGLGRFLSVDPVIFPSGDDWLLHPSPFGYAASSPVNAIDIDGRQPSWCGSGWALARDSSCDGDVIYQGVGRFVDIGCSLTRVGCVPPPAGRQIAVPLHCLVLQNLEGRNLFLGILCQSVVNGHSLIDVRTNEINLAALAIFDFSGVARWLLGIGASDRLSVAECRKLRDNVAFHKRTSEEAAATAAFLGILAGIATSGGATSPAGGALGAAALSAAAVALVEQSAYRTLDGLYRSLCSDVEH
jgi:RHS repeat-associated protein